MTRRDWMRVAASSAVLSSCGDRPAGPVALKVAATSTSPSGAPLYLAEERGYFREAGLEISVETANTVSAFVQLLASGAVDIALPALTPALVNAVPRGAGVKVVMARERVSAQCGGAGLVVARTASFPQGITDGRELRGKKVAILNPGAGVDFLLQLILDSAGVPREALEIVSLRPAESLAALQADQLDAFVSFGLIGDVPPDLRDRLAYFNPVAAKYAGQQASFVAYGPRLLGDDRDLGVRFLRVYLRATREWVSGATPRQLTEWAGENGIDPAMATSSCRDNLSPDGRIDAASLQRYADWLLRIGTAEVQVSAAGMMDTSLLDEASA